MANSLLDLGSMTNQAIQLGQLAQVQERNRISEQQNMIDAARVDQLNRFKTYDELEKQKADPLFITNLQRRVQLRQTQAKILGMPVPSTEELLGAEQEFDALTQAIRDPDADPEMRAKAASTFAVAAPGYGKQIYEALGAQQKYDQDSERHKILVQKYGSELTRLNQLIGRENIRQSVLTEELGKLSSVERIMDEHRPIITALANAKTDQERETIKRTRAQEWNAMQLATTQESTTYPLDQSKLYEKRQTLMQKRLQLQKMQKPIPPELDEEIAATELGYKALYAADRVLTDPTNKEVQRLFEIADQDVRLAYKSSGERMGTLRKERDDLRERHLHRLEAKDERANRIADAESYAQRRYVNYLNQGMGDNKAGELAVTDTEKAFPNVPVDMKKLTNLAKQGKTEISLTAGPGERKEMAEGRAIVATIEELEKSYDPKYVGWFDAPAGAFTSATGLISEKESDFRQAVRRYQTEQQHRIYGSALSGHEKKQALDAIPNIGMSDSQFKSALKESKKWEEKLLKERQGVIKDVGGKAPSTVPATQLRKQAADRLKEQFPGQDPAVIERFVDSLPEDVLKQELERRK